MNSRIIAQAITGSVGMIAIASGAIMLVEPMIFWSVILLSGVVGSIGGCDCSGDEL